MSVIIAIVNSHYLNLPAGVKRVKSGKTGQSTTTSTKDSRERNILDQGPAIFSAVE